jgi:hypothetical protein
MAVISTLVARMIADLSGWTPNMEKGKRDMVSFGGAAKKLQGMLGGLASGFSIAGIAYGALNLSKRANETLDLAQGLGISTEGLQSLRYAMTAAGGDAEIMTKGVNQMIRRLYDTTGGADKVSITLRKLGVSAKDIQSDPVKAISKLSDALKASAGSAEFAKDMFMLFGRSSIDMMPLLELGSAGIKEFADEAKRLGVVLSSADLMNTEKLSIQVAKSGQVMISFGQKALASLSMIAESTYRTVNNALGGMSPKDSIMGAWADMGNEETAAVEKRFKARKSAEEYADKQAKLNENLKEYLSIVNNVKTPQEKLNDQLDIADKALANNQTTLEEYNQTLSRLFDEFDRPEVEKMNKWAESLMEKSETPLEKYKQGLMEVLKLRKHFMADAVLTSGEQGILTNLANKYQEEALNELKPDKTRHRGGSFGELSPLMSMTGLQVGESIEQRQVAELAEIKAMLRAYLPRFGLN